MVPSFLKRSCLANASGTAHEVGNDLVRGYIAEAAGLDLLLGDHRVCDGVERRTRLVIEERMDDGDSEDGEKIDNGRGHAQTPSWVEEGATRKIPTKDVKTRNDEEGHRDTVAETQQRPIWGSSSVVRLNGPQVQ